jgi:hypothetical protein
MTLDNAWLKAEIEKMGFPCALSLFTGTQKNCVLVSLGEGSDKELQSMQLWLEPQKTEAGKEIALLQLFMPVCRFQAPFLGDIATLVLNANVGLDIPGFGISAQDKYVYYRSCSFLSDACALEVIESMMGLAMTYVDGFSVSMKALASGKKNYKQAVQELMQAAQGS